MPNDLSISDLGGRTAAAVNVGNYGAAAVMPAAPGKSAAPVDSVAMAASAPRTAPLPSTSPNPTLALNAALGLVVIEFRNAAGAVTSTIPTQKQLHAYQQWQESGVGPPPNIGGSGAGIAAASTSAAPGGNSRSTVLDVSD